jgi:hypothetical protein
MNTNFIVLITIGAGVLIDIGVTVFAAYLQSKGKNAEPILEDVSTGLGYAQSIANAVKPFLPGIAGNVIDVTLKYAGQAITRVEASYKAALLNGTAGTDTRKTEATSMITTALALEGISMTTDTQKLIDTVIPMLVMALPATHTAVAPVVPEVVPVAPIVSAPVTDAPPTVPTVNAQQ